MRKLSLSVLLLVSPVFGQLVPHTLTILATRTYNLQPDQIVFGLSVSSNANATLSQVAGALASAGVVSSNLAEVSNSNPTTLQWNFTLAVPMSSLTATIGSLANLQQTIGQNNSGLTLTFSLQGTQVSQQLKQSQSCSNADLVSDATAQAQKLTSAAGLTLGPVRLSNAPLQESSVPGVTVLLEDPYVAHVVPGNSSPATSSATVTCVLSVEFRLLP
jgi:hypothetical protein